MTSSSDLLDTLFHANEVAAAQGEFQVAYHTLMAALHVADARADMQALKRIAELAENQEAMIEAVQPPHILSSAKAKNRGQTPVFESLRIHIDAVRVRHEGTAAFNRARSIGGGRSAA
jgi:hypothetical protein